MSRAVLERQLTALHRRGYVGMTFAAAERARRDSTLPRRSVVVTFDDGYTSTLLAKPLLDSLGWPATVFAVTGFAASGRALQWPGIDEWAGGPHHGELTPLGWDALRNLASSGWEVGSHTVSHPRLPDLGDAELDSELRLSRAALAENVGSCETIAYPYGAVDARVASRAAAAGYLAACTLPIALRTDETHLRPRVGLYSNDVGARMWLKTSRPGLAARRSRLLAALADR